LRRIQMQAINPASRTPLHDHPPVQNVTLEATPASPLMEGGFDDEPVMSPGFPESSPPPPDEFRVSREEYERLVADNERLRSEIVELRGANEYLRDRVEGFLRSLMEGNLR
jgi:hypothetical protein